MAVSGSRRVPYVACLVVASFLALAAPSAAFGSGAWGGPTPGGAAALLALTIGVGVWDAQRGRPPKLTVPLRRAVLGSLLLCALGFGAAWLGVLSAVACLVGYTLVSAVLTRWHRRRRRPSAARAA